MVCREELPLVLSVAQCVLSQLQIKFRNANVVFPSLSFFSFFLKIIESQVRGWSMSLHI